MKEQKDSKLAKRTSGEAQLLDIAREDLKLKKAMLSSIETSKKGEKFKTLTTILSNCFLMFQGLLANVYINPAPSRYMQQATAYRMHQNSWRPQYLQPQASHISPEPESILEELLNDK